MNLLTPTADTRSAKQAAADEAVALLIGAGFTLALFLGLARFENFPTVEPVVAIEDLRMAAMPLDPPPPPPPQTEEPVPEMALPFTGIEVGATDSPVSITVVPPDLNSLPVATNPPRARVQWDALHAELKPRADMGTDFRHVYQVAEVDQKPRVLVRTVPPIPVEISSTATVLRVVLLVLIDQDGKPESTRVLTSSGNAEFDAVVGRAVQEEWLFSPAIRHGKKVRVLAEQSFRIIFSNGTSPFSVH